MDSIFTDEKLGSVVNGVSTYIVIKLGGSSDNENLIKRLIRFQS